MEPYGLNFSVNSTSETDVQGSDDLTNIRLIDICVYSVFFLIGGPANSRVLLILLRNHLYNKSRHHMLLLNLAIADTIVCPPHDPHGSRLATDV